MSRRSGSEKRQKTARILIRATPEQLASWKRKAAQYGRPGKGLPLAAYLRALADGDKLLPAADRADIADLNRAIGVLRWWLTDGEGKGGERHQRGPTPSAFVRPVNEIIGDIQQAVAKVLDGADGTPRRRTEPTSAAVGTEIR